MDVLIYVSQEKDKIRLNFVSVELDNGRSNEEKGITERLWWRIRCSHRAKLVPIINLPSVDREVRAFAMMKDGEMHKILYKRNSILISHDYSSQKFVNRINPLLLILMYLDMAIHDAKLTRIFYQQNSALFLDPQNTAQWCIDRSQEYQPLNGLVGEYLVRDIVNIINANVGLEKYHQIALDLAPLCVTQKPFSRVMYELVIGVPSPREFLREISRDKLQIKLLDTEISYTEKVNVLLTQLRVWTNQAYREHEQKVNPTRSFFGELSVALHWQKKEDTRAWKIEHNNKLAARLDKNTFIKVWFESLKRLQEDAQDYWLALAYNFKAHDKGFYMQGYTEITLLKQAHIFCNGEGRIEFDYLKSNAYKGYYAVGCECHEDLENELRFIAPLLGIEFEPGINFHDKVYLTRASSLQFMNKGLHFNEDYCKRLMRLTHSVRELMAPAGEPMPPPALPTSIVDPPLAEMPARAPGWLPLYSFFPPGIRAQILAEAETSHPAEANVIVNRMLK